MGITLTAKKSAYSFDMGAGSFYRLRANIANAWDKEFGEHYRGIIKCHSSAEYKEHDRIANNILSDPRFSGDDNDILDFLYAPDTNGKIGYRTCGKIYKIIKDVDFCNERLRYAGMSHNDYEELKAFLKECYSHRRNAYWK